MDTVGVVAWMGETPDDRHHQSCSHAHDVNVDPMHHSVPGDVFDVEKVTKKADASDAGH